MANCRIDALWLSLLLASACRPHDEASDIVVTLLDGAPTTARVTWRTDRASVGWVSFGVDGEDPRETPQGATVTEHEALLIGLPPEQTVIVSVRGEDLEPSAPVTVTAGSLPDTLPSLSTEGELDDYFRAVPLLSSETDDVSVVLLDPRGRIVWSHTDTRGAAVFRARVRRDGSGIVYSSTLVGGEPSASSALIDVSWDGTERVHPIPWLAHDFVELPDGTLASLAYLTEDGVTGNEIVLLSPSGEISSAWSTFDCFDPLVHTGDDPEHGWTHSNALDYDEDRDLFIVGLRNLGTIVEVSRAGVCGDAFGGSGGNVTLSGASFYHQHQFERLQGGLLVFDNDGAPGNESRVLEYSYTPGSGEANLVNTLRADPAVYSFILGDVHRADNGETTITWSMAGLLDRYAPGGERLMRMEALGPILFGFTHTFADPYRPQ